MSHEQPMQHEPETIDGDFEIVPRTETIKRELDALEIDMGYARQALEDTEVTSNDFETTKETWKDTLQSTLQRLKKVIATDRNAEIIFDNFVVFDGLPKTITIQDVEMGQDTICIPVHEAIQQISEMLTRLDSATSFKDLIQSSATRPIPVSAIWNLNEAI